MNKRSYSLATRIISQLFMLLMALVVLFPLYFVVVNAFKGRDEYIRNMLSLPIPPTLSNFAEAFRGKNFLQWFFNSAFISVLSIVLVTAMAFLAAYALTKLEFPGRKILFRLMLPLMSVPPVAMIATQFSLVARLGMINTYSSIILVYVAIMMPMTIYLFRNFMVSIPRSLTEAATIDGCNSLQNLTRIILPLSVPSLITAGVVNFVWVWNELLIALVFLQRESMRTLIVGITLFRGRYTLNVPVVLAGLVIVSVPVVIFYIFAQKYLVEGLLAGSVKE